MAVQLRAHESDSLPESSCFESLAESSAYFEGGSVGYSVTRDCCRLDGIRLQTDRWQVRPLAVEQVESSFFADEKAFSAGSVTFDHALIMRDISHQWHGEADMFTERTANQGAAANGLSAVRSSVAGIRERAVRSTAAAEAVAELGR
ncbi:MAG: hypothetical protein FJ271_34625 [Planctomycetes bacterium]|nr:hypothetical protein [Planctomycetota bacterium]